MLFVLLIQCFIFNAFALKFGCSSCKKDTHKAKDQSSQLVTFDQSDANNDVLHDVEILNKQKDSTNKSN